jgi:hypothetical protein
LIRTSFPHASLENTFSGETDYKLGVLEDEFHSSAAYFRLVVLLQDLYSSCQVQVEEIGLSFSQKKIASYSSRGTI